MYSRYSDVSMKNDTWRKICIRDIEGILMILKKGNIPKNEAKEELPRIEPLTSRFPHSDLDLDFFTRKSQIKIYKHCKTAPCVYAYHYILLANDFNWDSRLKILTISSSKNLIFKYANLLYRHQ
jgi:hypothetical protein